MPEILADRSSILRSKRQESSSIATSRKRKLREFWAVSAYDGTYIKFIDVDTPAPTPAEAQFLELNDILQGRVLNEASIPPRRQLRFTTAKGYPSGATGQNADPLDASRLSSKGLHDDGVRRSRGNTPGKESTDVPSTSNHNVGDISQPRHPTELNDDTSSKKPLSGDVQSDASPSPVDKLGMVIEGTNDGPALEQHLPELPPEVSQQHRIIKNAVESRSGSPGVDPRKAIPISTEDAANVSEFLINGSQDEHNKAVTAHLPSKLEEEVHFRGTEQSLGRQSTHDQKGDEEGTLTISLPAQAAQTAGDPMSSPGSTVDAQSATTPTLHEASTDTSPDNEGSRYNLDRADEKDDEPQTPSELALGKDADLEKEHDTLLKAQINVACTDILGSSLITADAQLRLEEEQVASASHEPENEMPGSNQLGVALDQDLSSDIVNRPNESLLAKGTSEPAQDIIDEDDDEVVGVPTPEDETAPNVDVIKLALDTTDESLQDPVMTSGLMDVDTGVVDARSPDITAASVALIPSKEIVQAATTTENLVIDDNEALSTAISTSSPHRMSAVTVPTPPTERMTTRVSSGAMRHKSVSEILGEIPRPNITSSSDRTIPGKGSTDPESAAESSTQSRATTPLSPASRMRSLVERAREKERSKLNMVVFAKHQPDRSPSNLSVIPNGAKGTAQDSGEYFMPLILAQAYNATRGIQPLEALLQSAHKTITTSNSYIPFHEHQTQKVLRRIHALQSMDKWTFRQPKRSPEPNRPVTHWDELLKEAKWMRTDFREERKWKAAIARNLAYACAEWAEANKDDRRLLQVKATIPSKESVDTEMSNTAISASLNISHSISELTSSAENGSPADEFDEEPRASLLNAVAPTALFSMSNDDVIFGLTRSPATDKLLGELPMYGLSLKVHQSDLPTSDIDPDASWRRPALPLNKYINSRIVLKDDGPPKKRSRYQYEEEDDEDEQVVFGQAPKRVPLEPVFVNVALFNPENKHIRDRIHAGHQFRPPSENPMPLQSFFECRGPSQWTWAEDDELKGLVREYSYNWQLISSILSSRSLFSSSAERRTPWECFERWIHLEGLPADMQKTHYFRAYNNRLEAAQRNLINQTVQAPSQLNSAGAAITPARRRTTTSIRVEKRRNQKHLTLVDAMRKLAKKRETNLQKQQHAASLAAMRKANEVPQPQGARHTPQDFSRLKYERELQLQERMARLQLQQEAQRRVLQQARSAQQQNPQQYASGPPQQRNPATANAMSAASLPPNANRPNQPAIPGQSLPHAQLPPLSNGMAAQPSMANGHGPVPQMAPKSVPQAQMQGIPCIPSMTNIPPQHRLPAPNPAPDLQLVLQARRISEQQRQAVQMQQQQHQGPNPQIHNSPPNMRSNMSNMNGMNNQQAFMQNSQAMMAAFNVGNGNGVSTPPANGFNVPSVGSAGSPRMVHPSQHPTGSISQVNKLEAQCRSRAPNATPDQINKMAFNQTLARQSAMHAAAGGGTSLPCMPSGMQASPQQIAQMLRAQQEKQTASLAQQNRSSSAGSNPGLGK